ncbi:MAG: amidohydrolase family protein, partial [Victivallaceae bacterium]
NLFPLVGHNTLRAAVNGYKDARLGVAQSLEMQNLLLENLREGALGLSSGLLYVPGKFADITELTELLRVVRDFDGIYALHLRSEGAQLLESITEAVTALQAAGGRKLHLSHFKTAGRTNWHKLLPAFEIMDQAAAESIRITCDRYPYIYSMSQLSIISPSPYDDLDDVALMMELKSQEKTNDFVEKMQLERADSYWKNIQLVHTMSPQFKQFCGNTFAQISEKNGQSAAKLVVKILQQDATNATAAFGNMSLENCRQIIKRNNCVCGSDESARPLDYSLGRSHPRNFGSMPEFYRMGVECGVTPERMIRKMSSLTAEIFNLRGRGRIAKGYFADLVLLDLSNYAGNATLIKPHQLSSGVAAVWINGQRFL